MKKKKNVAKVKYYNCGNKGHFIRDYTKPKRVNELFDFISIINVSNFIFLVESSPLWTVDLVATNHVVKDRDAFVEFRWLPNGVR